jgi:HrpA-like RNA helicase
MQASFKSTRLRAGSACADELTFERTAGKDAILKGIRENDTVIVLAETGSGKTTREFRLKLPKHTG